MDRKKEKREQDAEQERRDALLAVRAQALLVMRLRERMEETERGYLRAVRMDAQPRGAAEHSGLDAGMIRREEMARILKREEALYGRRERAARRLMEGMPPELYAFCALYYIGGMGLEEAGEAIGRSKRRCHVYKSRIEGKGTSFGEQKRLMEAREDGARRHKAAQDGTKQHKTTTCSLV